MNTSTYITGTIQTKAYRILREHVYIVLAEYDLTPTYWSMLGIIAEARNGVRQVEIAQALGVKAPLITTMARTLKKKGLILRAPNQFDSRANLLALSVTGKKFIHTVETKLYNHLEELLHGLSKDDLETYFKVLTTIIDNDKKIRSNNL